MMTTTTKTSCCAICENSNLASFCQVCVNYRLDDYHSNLRLLKSKRDALYSRLTQFLAAKGKADDQHNWRELQNEKLARLRGKLRLRKQQVLQGKAKIEKKSRDQNVKYELLESAMNLVEKIRAEQIEKYYPNLICTQSLGLMAITSKRLDEQSVIIKQICKLFPQRRVHIDGERKDGYGGPYDTICNARLPRGLDPHSVPPKELGSSLGYMVQLLNLVLRAVYAPALYKSGFAGSCSRIWQRESYRDAARPSSRSEFPLFIPRQVSCTSGGETSWTEKSSSNFGVASMESERRPCLDSSRGSSKYSFASARSVELHKDLQKGISLLKRSVACITSYCCNSLCLEVPSETTTFEALAKLLTTLSSSKEVQNILSLRMASSRPKPCQQLNTSIWKVESAVLSSTLMESAHALPTMMNAFDNYLPSFAGNSVYASEFPDSRKNENLAEGWNLVKHPKFPPPPSETENVEHWSRAMFIDATNK